MIRIYTDGACAPTNPGSGGFAYVVVFPDGSTRTHAESYEKTTNNRMELMAVLRAIQHYPNDPIHIYSDSMYVVTPISSGRLMIKDDDQIMRHPNFDLWIKLKNVLHPMVTCTWIRGHNGDEFNEMADRLSYEIIVTTADKKKDVGYKPKKRRFS